MGAINTDSRTLRKRRHIRVRAVIFGTRARPRLTVFRSNRHIYAQLVDDNAGKTLLAVSSLRRSTILEGQKTATAYQVGKILAEQAVKKGVGKVAFDRGGYKYHGRVRALSEGARAGGLIF